MAATIDTLHAAALAALAAGISVVPAATDGTKRPRGNWKPYMVQRPRRRELDAWFGGGAQQGLFVICGAVSGGLEMFEAESEEVFAAYSEAAAAVGLEEVWARVTTGYLSVSPGGSRHVLWRCPEIGPNTKLARRPTEGAEQVEVLLETRGEGGGTVEPPSSGAVHPAGGAYVQEYGGFASIAEITPEERRQLLALARTFDELPAAPPREPQTTAASGASNGTPDGRRPGDDLNARASWADILQPAGWAWVYRRGDVNYWRRPGKRQGVSATTNIHDRDLLKVFTSSTEFEADRTYSKFGAYAVLNCGGDFSAARRELFARGYGTLQTATEIGDRPAPAVNGTMPNGTPPEDPPPLDDREAEEEPPERPRIDAGNQDLEETSILAWQALAAANAPERLFRFGDVPVRIQRSDDDAEPFAQTLDADRLGHELARAASWYKQPKDGPPKPTAPPLRLIKDLLAAPDYPLPPLASIVQTPVFAPDGSLQLDPGYHPAGRSYYLPEPGFEALPVPETPTSADLERARGLILDDLLGDFPFISEAEQANAVALVLDRPLRNLIAGPTPLRLIEAPVPGSGKGLLADVALRPFVGRRVHVMPAAEDEAEWRKRVTAQLCLLPAAIVIDNVVKALDSGSLSSALTAAWWTDRRLGSNEMVNLPVRCVWLATANNPAMSTELARRTVRIRLDPKVDRPWQRTGFRHDDLRGWVDAHRAELVWAALVLGRHWIAEGMPLGGITLGSFEHWSQVLGGVLGAAEIEGFLGNLETFYASADLETEMWRQFVALWWERFGDAEAGVAELFGVAGNVEGFDFGKGTERAQKTAFGTMLMRQRDRVIGDVTIVNTRTVQRAKRWRLLRRDNPFGAMYHPQPDDEDVEACEPL